MSKTVVAIYNSIREAHKAADELLNNGFNSHDINISSGEEYADDEHREESGISCFFRNLFGDSDEKNERYIKVAELGHIVTVYAYSGDEAHRASQILDEYGAVDVDENYYNQFLVKGFKQEPGYSGQYDDSNYDKRDVVYSKIDNNLDERDTNCLENKTHDSLNGRYKSKNEMNDDGGKLQDHLGDDNKAFVVIEEDIKIGKKKVATGARVRSRIIEKPAEEILQLHEKHIYVKRDKVDRPATQEEFGFLKW